jgi:hypothetical protein
MYTTGYHIPENSNFHKKQNMHGRYKYCILSQDTWTYVTQTTHWQNMFNSILILNTPLAVVLYTLINDHFNSNTNTYSSLIPLISKCVKQCTEFKQSKQASQFQSCKSITHTQNVHEQNKLTGVMAKFPLKVCSAWCFSSLVLLQ